VRAGVRAGNSEVTIHPGGDQRGLTNKQIGASLFISDRTVGLHIQHIMSKLELGKRAEIATYVARHEAS